MTKAEEHALCPNSRDCSTPLHTRSYFKIVVRAFLCCRYCSLYNRATTSRKRRISRNIERDIGTETQCQLYHAPVMIRRRILWFAPIVLTLLFSRFLIYFVNNMTVKVEKTKKLHRPTTPSNSQRVTKQKKKPAALKSPPKSPEGYIFVPKGDVYITRKCTVLTQAAGKIVHIVCDNRTNSKCRIGIHVPKPILASVQADAASTATQRASAVQRKDDRDLERARKALRTRYPGMPVSDLEKVLGHAFVKGSGRVGRTTGTTEERRASLAVGAYVRHMYTPYDKLLKGMGRGEARSEVRRKVCDIKAGWRDELCR